MVIGLLGLMDGVVTVLAAGLLVFSVWVLSFGFTFWGLGFLGSQTIWPLDN